MMLGTTGVVDNRMVLAKVQVMMRCQSVSALTRGTVNWIGTLLFCWNPCKSGERYQEL